MALQIRRGTEAERTAGSGVVFAEGELVYITDTDSLYVGDGSTAGGVKLTDNTGSILGTYITANTINSTVDLQQDLDLNGNDIIGTGNININGTITATGNINIGDNANNDTVDFTAKITSSLIPQTDGTHDLGAISTRWQNGYFTGLVVDGQIDAGSLNADVVADNSTVMVDVSANTFTGNLTGNVTGDLSGNVTGDVSGNVTGNTTGYHTGDVKGSIFGDDSSPIVDAAANQVRATGGFIGDVTGNLSGNVKASNGSNILVAGTNGLDAEFTGTVTGNLQGNVTGNVSGNVTGNVTGNTTGYHTGDVKGSVFGDDSSPIVDAVSNQVRATGGFIGDVTGDVTGNVITSLIDSSDSSEIVVVPALRTQSDLTVEQSLNVGSGGIVLRNDGVANIARLEAAIITDSGFGSLSIETSLELTGGITSPGLGRFLDTLDVAWINDSVGKTLTVQKFTGDTENEAEVADPNNYTIYTQISDSKAVFGVPVQFPVVADDTARTALVPTPAKGMVILMESGTAPAATNQLQFFDGTNWVNV